MVEPDRHAPRHSHVRDLGSRRAFVTGVAAAALGGAGVVALSDPKEAFGVAAREFNVREKPYGASGDGKTDDTVAIQSAIDDAYDAGGGTVIVPRGRYAVTGLSRHFSGPVTVNIVGEGKRATRLEKAGGSDAPVLRLEASENVLETYSDVRDLSIVGTGNSHHGVELKNCARFSLERLDIRDCDRGVSCLGSLVFELRQCTLQANNYGITVRPSASIPGFSSNLIKLSHCEVSASKRLGCDFQDGVGIVLDYCDVSANGVAGDTSTGGVAIKGGTDKLPAPSWVTILNSWLEGNKGRAVQAFTGELSIYTSMIISSEQGRDVFIDGCSRFSLIASVLPTGGASTVEIVSPQTQGLIANTATQTLTLTNPANIMLLEGGALTGSQVRFAPIDAVRARPNSLFVDTVDGVLKFVDKAGAQHPLYGS